MEDEEQEEYFTCPECGHPLSRWFSTDEYGNLVIEFFCDGAGEDRFHFQIETDIADEELDALLKNKKPMKFEMTVRLLERKSQKPKSNCNSLTK
jgi:hypothetical protein